MRKTLLIAYSNYIENELIKSRKYISKLDFIR